MLAAVLGYGLVNAAQVVLVDKSGEYFNEDPTAKTDLAVADMVSRTFYLRPLAQDDHSSALKQPRHTPTDNVMISIYGVDATSLPSLESELITPLQGGQTVFATRSLAKALHETVDDASSLTTGRAFHKQTAVLTAEAENVFNVDLDLADVKAEAFHREIAVCKKAIDSLGSATTEKPQMSFLSITSVPSLSSEQQKEAVKAVNLLIDYAIEAMPENSIAEIMFLDALDLGALKLEQESKAFRRRRLLGNGSNSSDDVVTSNYTYMEMYTNQMKYWFLTASFIIVYVFSYCFAGMIYDDDKMLYTTFDANFNNKDNAQ